LNAPAKLNLYLHVTGRRDDGWHLLDSLVAFASVGDMVTVTPAERQSLTIEGPFAARLAGDPRDNLAWRAASLLAGRLGRRADVAIHLTKNLPVASGIGGGSSDAAACLDALAALWHCDDRALLLAVAAALGSDVPVCLLGRPAWLGGIGDAVDEASPLPECGVLLVNPLVALPTPSVYRAFAGPFTPAARFPIPEDAADFADMLAIRRNDLTDAATALAPAIAAVLDRLARLDDSLLARMSGSGATCFALFATPDQASGARTRLERAHPDWWVAAGRLVNSARG
jgi:4-diphosphocytidyl-2-C-methyl-D-erythritol kinase